MAKIFKKDDLKELVGTDVEHTRDVPKAVSDKKKKSLIKPKSNAPIRRSPRGG